MSSFIIISDIIAIIAVSLSIYFDLKRSIIPNWITFPLILFALVSNWYFFGASGFVISLLIAIISFLLFSILTFKEGFGGGDIKLITGISALFSFPLAFWLWFFISIYGGILAIVIIVRKKRVKQTLKNLLYIFKKEETKDRIFIPYSPAIWLGTVTVILKFHLLK